MGVQVDAGGGKRALGLSGRVPLRVPAATEHHLFSTLARPCRSADGWDHRRACAYLELGETRAWRWRERRADRALEDPQARPLSAARDHAGRGGRDRQGLQRNTG